MVLGRKWLTIPAASILLTVFAAPFPATSGVIGIDLPVAWGDSPAIVRTRFPHWISWNRPKTFGYEFFPGRGALTNVLGCRYVASFWGTGRKLSLIMLDPNRGYSSQCLRRAVGQLTRALGDGTEHLPGSGGRVMSWQTPEGRVDLQQSTERGGLIVVLRSSGDRAFTVR